MRFTDAVMRRLNMEDGGRYPIIGGRYVGQWGTFCGTFDHEVNMYPAEDSRARMFVGSRWWEPVFIRVEDLGEEVGE